MDLKSCVETGIEVKVMSYLLKFTKSPYLKSNNISFETDECEQFLISEKRKIFIRHMKTSVTKT